MNHVAIVSACRTPIGTIGGQFKTLTALDLSIPVMQALIQRSGVDPALIDDVIWGCNYQRTYLENNLARVAAIKAGPPRHGARNHRPPQLHLLHVLHSVGLLSDHGRGGQVHYGRRCRLHERRSLYGV